MIQELLIAAARQRYPTEQPKHTLGYMSVLFTFALFSDLLVAGPSLPGPEHRHPGGDDVIRKKKRKRFREAALIRGVPGHSHWAAKRQTKRPKERNEGALGVIKWRGHPDQALSQNGYGLFLHCVVGITHGSLYTTCSRKHF